MFTIFTFLFLLVCTSQVFAEEPVKAETKADVVASAPLSKSVSLTKLAHPSVAVRLALTDGQQEEIQKLIIERSQLLAKAPESDWNKIAEENEKKLEAVLTPAQKTLLPKVFSEKTIRINFKLQSWADVIQWFAEQAGLQLVMDVPPPGTFNYADQQDYTPAEALDKLNGVLQAKGFTLVRSDKMLMLFDLKKGKIPLQYLPKVAPEALPQQGMFEYVSSTFPLERRNQAEVVQAMVPFQGPFCIITPLPGNVLMISDTAGTLRMLQQVIGRIPNPPAPHPPEKPAPPAKPAPPIPPEYVVFVPKHISVTTAQTVLKHIYTEPNVSADTESGKIVIQVLPAQKPALQTLLEQLDAEDTDKDKMYFKTYPLDTGLHGVAANGVKVTPVMFVADLQRLAPKARISFEDSLQQILVWGAEYDHKIIEEALKSQTGNQEAGGKKYGHFPFHRLTPTAIHSVITRLFPTVTQAYSGSTLIVEGHPKQIAKIGELLEMIDPETQTANDPVVHFYTLEQKLPPLLVPGLLKICPAAAITADVDGKQLTVIAKAADQKIIADNLKTIATTYQAPEEPILCLYTVTQTQRAKLIGFIRATVHLRDITVVPDGFPVARRPLVEGQIAPPPEATVVSNQIAIWAKPAEQKIVGEILEQIKKEESSTPANQFKVFPMSVSDIATTRSLLRFSHPNVSVISDAAGNRIIVWGTADEIENVTKTLAAQGSIDDRQMFAYPVAGTDLKTVQKVIADVFSGLKITPEPLSKRLLVWASPEEHTKIAEIIEQTNKQSDPDSELSERFAAYPLQGLTAASVPLLFKTLFPEAEVFADAKAEKFIVKARSREHQQIAQMFEQLRKTEDKDKAQLAVYSIGESDPMTVESLLNRLLPDAESMTSDAMLYRLDAGMYQQRNQRRYYAYFAAAAKKSGGYYRVDDQSQSAHVFVPADKQKDVAAAIAEVVKNQESSRQYAKHYSLNELSYYDIDTLLVRVAPGAYFEAVYVYSPGQPVKPVPAALAGESRAAYHAQFREFTAYARENDHKKIAAIVKEVNEHSRVGKKEMLTLTLPDNSPYSREQIIATLQKVYPDAAAMPGGAAKQILLWAAKHRLDVIEKLVKDVCVPLPDGQQTVAKSYPVQYITASEAREWLSAMYPDISFDPIRLNDLHKQPAVPLTPGAAKPVVPTWAGAPRSDAARIVVAVATPLEHAAIEKTIQELDKELPDSFKKLPRIYTFPDLTFEPQYNLFRTLHSAYSPAAAFHPDWTRATLAVAATEDDHLKIASFIESYRSESRRMEPKLQIYDLKRNSCFKVSPLIQRIVPAALIFPGAQPSSIAVWGTVKEQDNVSQALTKLETSPSAESAQNLKLYKTASDYAVTARQLLMYQFPGAGIFVTNPNELIVWATPADHDSIASMLKTVAEAFPEPVVKTYYFRHVPLGEAAAFLRQAFLGRATLTPRLATDDLLVYALPDIQKEIAKNVADFDTPRPADAEAFPAAYDLSGIPAAWMPYTQYLLQQALGPAVLILPTVEQGQVIVWAKPAEQTKARSLLEQMLKESPAVSGDTQIYTLNKGTIYTIYPLLSTLIPNARIALGTKANQFVVRGKETEQAKVRQFLDSLEKADADVKLEIYSLKNIFAYGPFQMLQAMIAEQGLDIKIYYDANSKQLAVQAKPEIQKMVADLLEKFRQPNRDLAVFALENVDPVIAYRAINTLFEDESAAATPSVEIDQNTNMIFVLGTKEQLETVRKKLQEMGEPVSALPADSLPGGTPPATNPATSPSTSPSMPNDGGKPLSASGSSDSKIRTLQIRGSTPETLREVEKLWKLSQPNKLQIIKEDETPDGLFSVEDEVQRDIGTAASPTQNVQQPELPAKVYLITNEDGSITAASQDTSALNYLESLIKRIDSGIVFEGRDYTIFSVRNISADVVALKLRFILQQHLTPARPAYGYGGGYGGGYGYGTSSPLTIREDITSNTIYVRGPKRERLEVAKLLTLLDVSELPGERMVRRPVKVPIKNTQALRVYYQVLNVYQQKMLMTRLPGGQYPRIIVDNLTNSLEIIAPEPLVTELREYAEDIDRRVVEEPGRKIHVIPLNVKSTVVQNAIRQIQMSAGSSPYAAPMPVTPYAPVPGR
ncbi:MAG: hypothetical protein LBT89_12290 [Planctomycetaceae bacterium]|jgi:type II secretory pathway component GspD/PulD (secretin)|nr:hypothetical protein [Planctomycetaceae bacterium]